MNSLLFKVAFCLMFFVVFISSPLFTQVQVGDDIDGLSDNDWFGYSIDNSDDGSRIAIGAPRLDAGYVAVYELQQGQWQLLGDTIEGKADFIAFGEQVALSGDGNRLAITALGFDNIIAHVRVYEWQGSDWIQIGNEISSSNADYIGSALALSRDGNHLAVGNEEQFGFWGQVRTFRLNNNDKWVQYGETLFGRTNNDFLGSALAISDDGSRIIIGAADTNDGIDFAQVYEFGGLSWEKIGEVFAEENEGEFGAAVAISGSGHRIAVGSPTNSGNGQSAGSVRIYEQDNDRWIQIGGDIDGETSFELFGYDISISSDGNRLLAGARNKKTSAGDFTGEARLYDFDNNEWIKKATIDGEAEGDKFGWAVTLSGDGKRFAAGALFNDGNGEDAGHVRVFELTTTSVTVEQTSANSLSIQPNPSSGTVNLTGSLVDDLVMVQIYSSVGTLIHQVLITQTALDLSSLSPGVYFLRFNSSNHSFPVVRKLIIR